VLRRHAAEQGDEADEAFGGTNPRASGARPEVPPHARAVPFLRGHRFAAYPRCSTDAGQEPGHDVRQARGDVKTARTARGTGLALCLLVVGGATQAAAGWKSCAAPDRATLLVAALLQEVGETANESRPVAHCVVVAIGSETQRKDPSDQVLFRLQRLVRQRVVAVSKASECPGAPQTWVGQPKCDQGAAIVRTQHNWHCALSFSKEGGLWERESMGACE
jgi:hypothetical protein